MNKQKRALALILCVGMIFVLFASSACIAHEAEHHCAGEDCEICECITWMEALLHSFALLGAALLLLFTLPSFLRAFRAEERLRAYAAPTLVGWKVRLNNLLNIGLQGFHWNTRLKNTVCEKTNTVFSAFSHEMPCIFIPNFQKID